MTKHTKIEAMDEVADLAAIVEAGNARFFRPMNATKLSSANVDGVPDEVLQRIIYDASGYYQWEIQMPGEIAHHFANVHLHQMTLAKNELARRAAQ